MLIDFSVENFLSFKGRALFSMEAVKALSEHRQTHICNLGTNIELLRSSVFYGANASGKSNFIKAIGFYVNFVKRSSDNERKDANYKGQKYRLDTANVQKPVFFEMRFLLGKDIYRLGFTVNDEVIEREWLYIQKNAKGKEAKLYERHLNNFDVTKEFAEGKNFQKVTRANALFVSTGAQFNGTISTKIVNYFKKFIFLDSSKGFVRDNYDYFNNNENKNYIQLATKFLTFADIQLADMKIDVESIDNVKFLQPLKKEIVASLPKDILNKLLTSVKIGHKQYAKGKETTEIVYFDLEKEESSGTGKLFGLIPLLIEASKSDHILIADELDIQLHPLIIENILNWFNIAQSAKAVCGQLIFSTHNTNILKKDIFRRDQIWFSEKDKQGASHIYSLSNFTVRKDANYGNDYIKGKFGAIPYTKSFNSILGGK